LATQSQTTLGATLQYSPPTATTRGSLNVVAKNNITNNLGNKDNKKSGSHRKWK